MKDQSTGTASQIQLPLNIQLLAENSFETYVPDRNSDAISNLKKQLQPGSMPLLYLWGQKMTGCSHLLQAACNQAAASGKTCVYLPMEQFSEENISILDGMEQVDLICIDHLQLIAGQPHWNEALFHLFNRVIEAGSALLLAGDNPPQAIGFRLPDLVSRLASCVIYQILPLTDAGKILLLENRAKLKGLQLSEDAAQFILNRADRGVENLLEVLESLDRHSLAAMRKLTIPFIKDTMGW